MLTAFINQGGVVHFKHNATGGSLFGSADDGSTSILWVRTSSGNESSNGVRFDLCALRTWVSRINLSLRSTAATGPNI